MLITIATYNSAFEAHIDQSLLNINGIDSFIADQNMGSLYPTTTIGGIRLQVAESDVEKALYFDSQY
jgi:hypothetical protein